MSPLEDQRWEMPHTYRCTEFPGMEGCPGAFTAATREEVRLHVELHAREAHEEDPAEWSTEDSELVERLIKLS